MAGRFADRQDAGRQLAAELVRRQPALQDARRPAPPLVLAIPRGGAVVAAEVARALSAPMDILVTCKVGHPANPEAAIGAVDPAGQVTMSPEAGDWRRRDDVELARARALATWHERNRTLRQGRPEPPVRGRTVVVVDDGIATGATAVAALGWLRRAGASPVILAVPVGPADAPKRLAAWADAVVCLIAADAFWAVGQFYLDFRATPDAEVLRLMAELAPD